MEALSIGLTALFNTVNDFKTSVGSQFYPAEADQENAAFPYCVYDIVTVDRELDFSDEHQEFLVQITPWSENNSKREILDIYEKLKTLFDEGALTVTGWRVIDFDRQPSQGETRNPEDNTWFIPVDYNILLERERS